MPKTVFLFSGQGSQYPGMALELIQYSAGAAAVFDCASEMLGMDLKKLCETASAEELSATAVSQPAIMATSLAALCCVREAGIEAEAVAGHSLGEYAAMAAAGMLPMEEAFKLIGFRAAAMGRCAEGQDGGMAAVLGLTAEEVAEVCEKTSGYVVPVNFNSAAQTVIAGEKAAVAAACETFAAMGKRTAPLAVSAAFHSKLMQPAADEFYEAAKGFSFAKPKLDFYANLTGGRLEDFSDMPGYLAKHIVSPVRFTDELSALQAAGFDRYLELGPGKVLSGLVKRTLKGVEIGNVEDLKTLQKAIG